MTQTSNSDSQRNREAAGSTRRSPRGLWATAKAALKISIRQPVIVFGLALIVMIWLGVELLIGQQRKSAQDETLATARNLSIVLEREIIHTVNDLDRILMFLRWNHAHNPQIDWATLVTNKYTVDKEAVQIAVIDPQGVMLTSSVMPHPKTPIDLSDREHFQAQLHAASDNLFIGKPLIGRASSKPSVQFSRRLTDANGAFAGVIVASLDPALLTRAYSDVKLGGDYGLALIGDDGVVRSGAGSYRELLGDLIPGNSKLTAFFKQDVGSIVTINSREGVEVVRCVEGLPLNVVVSLPGVDANPQFAHSVVNYRLIAAVTSLFVVLATASAALRRHRYERRMERMAKFDALTRLPNRCQLNEKLAALFALPPAQRAYALHVVDLDGFKFVNDTYGHLVGDELLKIVARRLAQMARNGEIIARLGGDEFAIIQPIDDPIADAARLAEKVVEGLSKPCLIGHIDITVGASVGIASALSDGDDASGLLQAADLALYSAKASGRGAFQVYDERMMRTLRNRVSVETGLRQALAAGHLELHYQPIVSATDRRIIGFEALARWNRPGVGLVYPGDFISVAEETGLIGPMGEWILRRACADVARLGGDYLVAVNFSPRQFAGAGVVDVVRAALEASGLSADRLEIEITESMLLKEDASVISQLTELRALGARISMDDFGTGYSSLSYLKSYPIDRIKIDRAFISALVDDPQMEAVVNAIVQLAAAFGIRTLAEGVETEDQMNVLRKLGCFELQGYLFGKPQPIGRFAELAASATTSVAA